MEEEQTLSRSKSKTGKWHNEKSFSQLQFDKRKIEADKQLSNIFYLGQKFDKEVIYKYLDLESTLLCLNNGNIRFVQPTKWADKYECRFYDASYAKLNIQKKEHPHLYACCFTTKKMSEAAWKIYSYGKTGLAHRCVKLGIDINKLRNVLNTYAQEKGFYVYESIMNYSLSDDEILNMHKKKSSYYSGIFKHFDLASYLTLLSIKRNAFSHECELRYFLVKKDDSQINEQEFVELPYKELIVDVKIAEDASEMELGILKTYCDNIGINKEIVEKEKLYKSVNANITIEGDKVIFANEIIEFIKKNQGIQMKDIVKELGMSAPLVKRYLTKYAKEGYITFIHIKPKGCKWYTSDYQLEELK